ncbi:hypothetical protein [Sphingomonas crusticola]|uniref:hypothetical protein n=1 Tax=Sphingomonas crusticola TaxID=1697973 RepID=UPI0013C31E56|nr:hypothetical protein [Sphingomonas crusticola]
MLTSAFRLTNKILGQVGLGIQRVGPDFTARLADGPYITEMCRRIAARFEDWKGSQTLFESLAEFDTAAAVEQFYNAYLNSPFRTRQGGSRFNNMVLLFLMARSIEPTAIIDSGSFQGASAWALAQGAPKATTISFDIDMSRVLFAHPGVQFVEADWTTYDWATVDMSNALAYFDDHIDQVRRTLESSKAGVNVILFDDDLSLTAFPEMAHGGMAIPKIEFVFDAFLAGQGAISWLEGGRERRWEVDQDYLQAAREVIDSKDRLPDTSAITGIHQLPYSVVKLKKL